MKISQAQLDRKLQKFSVSAGATDQTEFKFLACHQKFPQLVLRGKRMLWTAFKAHLLNDNTTLTSGPWTVMNETSHGFGSSVNHHALHCRHCPLWCVSSAKECCHHCLVGDCFATLCKQPLLAVMSTSCFALPTVSPTHHWWHTAVTFCSHWSLQLKMAFEQVPNSACATLIGALSEGKSISFLQTAWPGCWQCSPCISHFFEFRCFSWGDFCIVCCKQKPVTHRIRWSWMTPKKCTPQSLWVVCRAHLATSRALLLYARPYFLYSYTAYRTVLCRVRPRSTRYREYTSHVVEKN